MAISRFGVSLEENLLTALDNFVKENKFANRSQALRYLIEKNLVEKKWQCDRIVAGAIVLLYNHHKKDLSTKLTDIQHDFHEVILATQHFHLDEGNCMEIVSIKGPAHTLTELSDLLISIKGIKYGKLVMSQAD
ncbi:MAG: nickel-responsive transcriptional regulator NikR [Bacteroidota bacterium]|nr:nickel-responsive transcriptional regulator NikR [Bacteroidota bacterium]MDP4273562.1 nickel-responsive transcriptional regulator NikR [Bacteroidota bacterium]